MTHFFKTTLALGATLALFAAPALATDKKAEAAKKQATTEVMTANSSMALSKEFTGKHIDELPDVETSTKAVDNPDRVICKEIEKTGSRLRKRKVCATKKEWDYAKTQTVNAVRLMQVRRGAGD